MEIPQSKEFQRDEELEKEKDHYHKMMTLKEDRLAKLNERVKLLETENENFKSEIIDLKDENDKIRKKYTATETLRIETQINYEAENKRYEDLKSFYEKWKDIDLSKCFNGETVNEELVKKRLHYNTVKMNSDNEKNVLLQEMISSLETRVRLQESIRSQPINSSPGVLDNMFGRTKLKLEIENLAKQNEILRNKEENVSKLIKVQKLELDGMNKVLNDKDAEILQLTQAQNLVTEQLKEKIQKLESSLENLSINTIVEAAPDPQLAKELEQAKVTIQKKDSAMDGMKQRINQLMDDNGQLKSELENFRKESRHPESSEINLLKHQLNSKTLEYEQLEMKFRNAEAAVETYHDEIASLKTQLRDAVPELLIQRSRQTRAEESIRPINFTNTQVAPPRQVFNQDIPHANCPCCDRNMPISEVEAHLEECLNSQS